jgi:short-subunit dehydrogenase
MAVTNVAMVTGASSGIGEAFAERLAADGHDLVVVARRRQRLEELAERLEAEHGVAVRVIEADLGDPAQIEALCDEIETARPELLVNNAGLAHYMPFVELPPLHAQELVTLNVLAPVLLSRAAVNGMVARGRGSIVNVASLLAFSGPVDAPHLPNRAVYAATKSFLVTFSETLAREVSTTGVQVQVLCPGVVRSEFHTRQGMDLSSVPRMEPRDVVDASLADLADGVVVSIPGLADLEAYARLEAADRELLSAARTTELPDRYPRS